MGYVVEINSDRALVLAQNTTPHHRKTNRTIGRLGNTPFCLGKIVNQLTQKVMLPVSELNRMRREIVTVYWNCGANPNDGNYTPIRTYRNLSPALPKSHREAPQLIVLARNLDHIQPPTPQIFP